MFRFRPGWCLNPCSNGILKYVGMELTLTGEWCLNPCSNGILKYTKKASLMLALSRLNPCSNGILKYQLSRISRAAVFLVLILVLMEY